MLKPCLANLAASDAQVAPQDLRSRPYVDLTLKCECSITCIQILDSLSRFTHFTKKILNKEAIGRRIGFYTVTVLICYCTSLRVFKVVFFWVSLTLSSSPTHCKAFFLTDTAGSLVRSDRVSRFSQVGGITPCFRRPSRA